MDNITIIELTEKQVTKIIEKGKLENKVVCGKLNEIGILPIGVLNPSISHFKLSTGGLFEQQSLWKMNPVINKILVWSWIHLPAELHNNICSLFRKKNKKYILDKWKYFEIIEKKEHPLEKAKSYFVKQQDYEMANKMRTIIKQDEKKKKDKEKDYNIFNCEVEVDINKYNIKTKRSKDGSSKNKRR